MRRTRQLALLLGIVYVGITLCAATVPTTQPAAVQQKYERGEKLRQILLDALEQSFENNGPWPNKTSARDDDLVYTKPPNSVIPPKSGSVIRSASEAPATVVVHERFDQHPDGIWVGYADGHLEFAPTIEALKDCQSQLPILARSLSDPATQPAPADGRVTLRIVDPQGKPLGGAKIGTFMTFGYKNFKTEPPYFINETAKSSNRAVISDRKGIATLDASAVFDAKFTDQSTVPIYIYQRQRQLIAEIDVNRSDFQQDQTLRVRALPACNLRGRLSSVDLVARKGQLSWTNVIVFKPGLLRYYTLECSSDAATFQMPLAPGDYGLEAYGTDSDGVYRYIHVDPVQTELRLQLDLPIDVTTRLVGHPAPELTQIKGWKNGGPVTLADLRGKVVILEFWGYWCGPCVGSMPAMMQLYDETKNKGLVIIAVHDDSLDSIAELDQKLEGLRHKDWPGWNGRNLPFLIALDGGGNARIKYTSYTSRGATTAAYGISSFPSTIAIGRDGNVIGEVSVRSPEGLREIEKLADSK